MSELSTALVTGAGQNVFVALCVLVALQLIFRVGVFVWNIQKEKTKLSEISIQTLAKSLTENTGAIEDLKRTIGEMDSIYKTVPRLKNNVRQLFFAVRTISGDRWPEIKKIMVEIENLQGTGEVVNDD